MSYRHLKDLLHEAIVRRANVDVCEQRDAPAEDRPNPAGASADTTAIDEAAE